MKQTFTAFLEHKEFKDKKPWDVNILHFPFSTTVPPHYADTVEILLCNNVSGTLRIGEKSFELCGKQVYYIAPNIVHSIFYRKNEGYVYVIKIHTEGLSLFCNLPEILKFKGENTDSFSCLYEDYDYINSLCKTLNSQDEDIYSKLCAILMMFKYFSINNKNNPVPITSLSGKNNEIYKIITWTEENFQKKISVDIAANVFGYTKNYFCNKFKKETGVTYINYLNNVRISNACKLLLKGVCISDAAEQSGFCDVSYFIQRFKKIMGTTPKNYSSGKI